jgi:hypothetical protein
MKRRSSSKLQFTKVQLQLDNQILEKNVFLPRNKEPLNLRDFVALLKKNLVREELVFIQKEFSNELNERASIVCEGIPDDVWMIVFRLLGHNKDIKTVFPLKQVCKRWQNSFPNSITDALVLREESLSNGVLSLQSVRSLTVKVPCRVTRDLFEKCFTRLETLVLTANAAVDTEYDDVVPNKLWTQMTNLKTLDISHLNQKDDDDDDYSLVGTINNHNLKLLTNLQTLKIGEGLFKIKSESLKELVHLKVLDLYHFSTDFSRRGLEKRYGVNLNILDSLKELEVLKLTNRPFFSFIKYNYIKDKYPHLRLIIRMKENSAEYEGDFSDNNEHHGKGKWSFDDGEFSIDYEGEFKDGNMTGKGVMVVGSGETRFEGEFKDATLDGKGLIVNRSGVKIEGEFKKGVQDGKGSVTHPDGYGYEGEFKDGKMNGKGVMYFSDSIRYEGEFKDGRVDGKGVAFLNDQQISAEFKTEKVGDRNVCFVKSEDAIDWLEVGEIRI